MISSFGPHEFSLKSICIYLESSMFIGPWKNQLFITAEFIYSEAAVRITADKRINLRGDSLTIN